MLTSPRVVVDADGEFLYIPADRALAARAQREAEIAAAQAAVEAEAAAQAELEAEAEAAELEAIAAAEAEAAELAAAEAEAVERAVAEAHAAQIAAAEAEAAELAAVQAEAAEREAARTQAAERLAARLHGADRAVTHTWPTRAPASSPVDRSSSVDRSSVDRSAADRSVHERRSAHEAGHAHHERGHAGHEPDPAHEVHERPYDLEVAIALARIAARRRAVIMTLLLAATVSSWGLSTVESVPLWVAAPATVLLVLHILASRVAGLRSRETLMLLAAQLHTAEAAQARPQHHVAITARPPVPAEGVATTPAADRVARRAAAVGAETWQPIPVPPPTYTLKPAVHRAEPAPLEQPAPAQAPAAQAPAAGHSSAPAAVSRGALPRRAADIERILALESDLDQLFQHRAG